MSPMLKPTRFRLSEDQVTAALALAKISPTKKSMLPDSKSASKPLPALKGSGILADDNKKLTAEALASLRIAANPSHLLSIIANNSNDERWVETSVLHGNQDDAYIFLASDNKKYDFAFIPSPVQATVLLDDMLGITATISRPGKSQFEFELAGYAAILAMADLIQETRLRARLERARKPVPAIAIQALEDQLKKGLDNTDTRWAVTAGRMVCPTHLKSATGRLQDGAEQLKSAGFLEKSGSDYSLTQTGFMLGSSLGQLVNTAGFSLAAARDDSRLTIAHTSLFRTAFSIWIVSWSEVKRGDLKATLFEASASSTIGFIRNLLKPAGVLEKLQQEEEISPFAVKAPAPVAAAAATAEVSAAASTGKAGEVTCRFCGKKNEADSAFCHGCGRELPKRAAAKAEASFCRHCGRMNAADARFCNGCGKEIA